MSLTPERLAELRELVETESMSWGDIAELQGAFEQIDPETLPEPAENAGWSDMLDELEARATEPCAICHESIRHDGTVWRHLHADRETYCGTGDGSVATPASYLRELEERDRRAWNVAHHEPTD